MPVSSGTILQGENKIICRVDTVAIVPATPLLEAH